MKKHLNVFLLSAVAGSFLFSGCTTLTKNNIVSSNIEIGSSLSARGLECCLSTEESIERKMFDHIQKHSIFSTPDKNNDFGLTWHIKGDGKGIEKGTHILVLEYSNADSTNPNFGYSKVSVELPFIVMNPEVGQHTISFLKNGTPDYSVERKNNAALLAPIDLIIQDAKRVQGMSDLTSGPQSASVDYKNSVVVNIGQTNIVSLNGKTIQHIVAYDASGNRMVIDQEIKDDSYRFVKNNEKCVVVHKNGEFVVLPMPVGLDIQKLNS